METEKDFQKLRFVLTRVKENFVFFFFKGLVSLSVILAAQIMQVGKKEKRNEVEWRETLLLGIFCFQTRAQMNIFFFFFFVRLTFHCSQKKFGKTGMNYASSNKKLFPSIAGSSHQGVEGGNGRGRCYNT